MPALALFLTAAVAAAAPLGPATADDYVGGWNVRLTDATDTFTGAWFDIRRKGQTLEGSLVWRWGSVVPATRVEISDGSLRFEREEKPGRPDVFTAQLENGMLRGEVRYADGTAHRFEGRRAPKLASTRAPRWGAALTLFDGKTLDGWKLRDPKARMGWAVVNSELAVVEPKGNADLVTEKTFQDMRLQIEVNVDPKSNSGVYLRGRYEVQILDDATKTTESHGMGALYSRIPAALDITLVGRRLTVVLNGKTIIADALVEGITGGAISPFEDEPGPLMLQGDHGKVRFRKIVVTPAE